MENPQGGHAGKYARWELERRFLIEGAPPETRALASWRITDRYLDRARLRLRRMEPLCGGKPQYKLTQKDAPEPRDTSRTIITTIYLSPEDYAAFADLPARELTKRRDRVDVEGRLFSVDAFEGHLKGLFLAEVSFVTEEELEGDWQRPAWLGREVTRDLRYTGGALARLTAQGAAQLLGA